MLYLEQMENMRERQARQLQGKELDIHIKEMHAHMRCTELEQQEEELREREELSRRVLGMHAGSPACPRPLSAIAPTEPRRHQRDASHSPLSAIIL
jgi:hypothetical protein